jgi:hypothetical protein
MGLVVTTRRDLASAGGMEFVGQDFALRRRWNPVEVGCTWRWPPECSAAVEWLLFRRTPVPPAVDEWAVLWVKGDQGAVISEQ